MRTISKCVVLGLIVAFFVVSVFEIGAASNMREADELFDKGTFQEALEVYESVLKESTDGDTKWRAFFRSCESLTHLFVMERQGKS